MRSAALVFLMLSVLYAILGPAMAEPACLQRTQTVQFQPRLGNRAVIVTDRRNNKFLVSFAGACRVLEDTSRLGFQTLEQSRVACVERGDFLVSLRDVEMGGMARSCGVQKVEPYTAEMEKADTVERAMDRVAR